MFYVVGFCNAVDLLLRRTLQQLEINEQVRMKN
jgi:hypothetical protein